MIKHGRSHLGGGVSIILDVLGFTMPKKKWLSLFKDCRLAARLAVGYGVDVTHLSLSFLLFDFLLGRY